MGEKKDFLISKRLYALSMETAIKTIVTLVLVLTVLMVVSIYFTTGTFQIYNAASDFEEKSIGEGGGAGWVYNTFVEKAWSGDEEHTSQETLVMGVKLEKIKNCIQMGLRCAENIDVKKNLRIEDAETGYFKIIYEGAESVSIVGTLAEPCSCTPTPGKCLVETIKNEVGKGGCRAWMIDE